MNQPINNPMQFMQAIRGGQNPQQLMLQMLQQRMGNTPMGQNLMQLAQNNDTAGIEQIARNLCAQRGLDFDQEFSSFKKRLGL